MTETRADRGLISSGSPFERIYGYSRALRCGDEVLVSGTTGYDYAKMAMPEDVAEQTRNIYATLAQALKEAGGELADIVQTAHFRHRRGVLRTGAQGSGRGFRRDPPRGDDRRRLRRCSSRK